MTQLITRERSFPTLLPETFLKEMQDILGADFRLGQENSYPYNVLKTMDGGRYLGDEIQFALAGIPKENIAVKVINDHILIAVDSVEETDEVRQAYRHRGISRRSMRRKIPLSPDADAKSVTSRYKDGILTIKVPFKEPDITDVDIQVS